MFNEVKNDFEERRRRRRRRRRVSARRTRGEAKARADATWHGWSGRVVWGVSTTTRLSLSPAMSERNPVL